MRRESAVNVPEVDPGNVHERCGFEGGAMLWHESLVAPDMNVMVAMRKGKVGIIREERSRERRVME